MTKHLDAALSDLPSHAHGKPALRWTAGPWAWREFGGSLMLVTEHGGSKVVLSSSRGPILTRGIGGQLEPLTEDHPIARLTEAAPDMASALLLAGEALKHMDHTDELLAIISAALKKAGAHV